MADNSKIEWTEATWNPVTGCTEVSPGCDHCYAKRIFERFHGKGSFGVVRRDEEKLFLPMKWKRPRRVFVNSMSDLFHDNVPDSFIAHVFSIMARTPQHTYQVLTKRHGRMRSLLSRPSFRDNTLALAAEATWPLPNVWLGVSVENQQWANIRIPALLDTPAAVRWLSCEPLLGPVNIWPWLPHASDSQIMAPLGGSARPASSLPGIDWVVAGGESGPGARPMHPAWARTLRDQCEQANVPFFYKQTGEWIEDVDVEPDGTRHINTPKDNKDRNRCAMHPAGMTAMTPDNPFDPWQVGHPHWTAMRRVGKNAAGRILDGRTHDQYPAAVA